MSVYLPHFGLARQPFSITPATDFFYSGAQRGEILDALLYAVMNVEGIVKITGEVGSGKTMLCRKLIEKFPANIDSVYLANPALSREEMLFAVCDELGVDSSQTQPHSIVRTLQQILIEKYRQDRRVVVVIDEAHAMPNATLEELRLLYNLESNRHKLLQIVLFGQTELDEKLALPQMRQLKERITHHFSLAPMVFSVTEEYLAFRMQAAGSRKKKVFSPRAARLIWRKSKGLSRRINILADKALLAAYIDDSDTVERRHAKTALADSGFATKRPHWGYPASLSAALCLAFFSGTHQPPPVEARASPVRQDLFSSRTLAFAQLVAKRQGIGATILLTSQKEEKKAKHIIAEAEKLLDPNMIYAAKMEKNYWLFYGAYRSTEEAKKAIATLPETIRLGFHPVARPFSDFSIQPR